MTRQKSLNAARLSKALFGLLVSVALSSPVNLSAKTLAPSAATAAEKTTLSPYDIRIITDYTSRGYFINNMLKYMLLPGTVGVDGMIFAGRSPNSPLDYQYITHLNRALAKLPPYREGNGVVYRGIYSDPESDTGEVRFPEGKVWFERRYTSTSTSLDVAKDFAKGAFKNEGCGGCDSHSMKTPKSKYMSILTIESLNGRDISGLVKNKEREVLFKSGTIFKVLKSGRDDRGRFVARIKELDPANLTAEEIAGLQKSETEHFQKIYASEFLERAGVDEASAKQNFDNNIAQWKKAHAEWSAQNILGQDIDFDAIEQEGGG